MPDCPFALGASAEGTGRGFIPIGGVSPTFTEASVSIFIGILAIVVSFMALVVTAMIVYANGMSDAPSAPFEGGWLIALAWAIAGGLWVGWFYT